MRAADGIFVEIGVDEAAYAASLRRMIGATNAAATRIEAAFGKIGAASGASGAMAFARNMEDGGKRIQTAGFGWGSGLQGIAVQMAGFALIMGAAGAGGAAIKSMADFEQTLAMLTVVTNSAANDMEPLRTQALRLGQDTALAATDVATLQIELGKLGYTLKQIEALTPGGVNLAIVADMPTGATAEFLGAVVKQFKAAPEEVNHYVDVLAAAANRTAADIDELAYSFKYVGAPAKQAGASFEQVAAILGVAADNGIAASMAGTSLRSAFQDLAQLLPMTVQGLSAYGIKIDTTKNGVERFYDVLRQIEEKNINPLAIRGLEADTATLLAALKGSSERLRTFAADLKNVDGEAKRVADAKMAGLTGATRELSGAFETLAIKIGELGVLDALTVSVRGLKSGLEGLAGLTDDVENFFTRIANSPAAQSVRELFDRVGAAISAQAAQNAGSRQSFLDTATFGAASAIARNPYAQAFARGNARLFGFDGPAPGAVPGRGIGRFGDPGTGGAPIYNTDPATTPPARPPPTPLILTPQQARAREIAQLKELAAAAELGTRALQRMQAVHAEINAGDMEGGISRATAERRALEKEELNGIIERAQKQEAATQGFLDRQQAMRQAQVDFRAALGQTNDEQNALTQAAREGVDAYEKMAIAVDLMRQNTALTKAEALELAAAIQASQKQNDRAVERMRDLQQAGQDMGDAVAGAFEELIVQGESFRDVIRALAVDILQIAVRSAITKPLGDSLGRVLSSIFTAGLGLPGRANGGPVSAGMAYRVGERGPETFVPSLPGKIVPAGGKLGGGGGVVINDNRVIDARGADAGAVARIERLIMADRAQRRAEFGALLGDYQTRHG